MLSPRSSPASTQSMHLWRKPRWLEETLSDSHRMRHLAGPQSVSVLLAWMSSREHLRGIQLPWRFEPILRVCVLLSYISLPAIFSVCSFHVPNASDCRQPLPVSVDSSYFQLPFQSRL